MGDEHDQGRAINSKAEISSSRASVSDRTCESWNVLVMSNGYRIKDNVAASWGHRLKQEINWRAKSGTIDVVLKWNNQQLVFEYEWLNVSSLMRSFYQTLMMVCSISYP